MKKKLLVTLLNVVMIMTLIFMMALTVSANGENYEDSQTDGTQSEAKLVYSTSDAEDAEEVTEYHATVESAMDKIVELVEDGIHPEILHPVITLLTDRSDTLEISGDLPQFRIDLNGYDIICPDDSALIISEGINVSVVNLHKENESIIKTESSSAASIVVKGRLSLVGKTFVDTGVNKLTVGGETGILLSDNMFDTLPEGYCELSYVNFSDGKKVFFESFRGTLHINTDLTDTIYVDRNIEDLGNTAAVITVGMGLKTTENLDKIIFVNETNSNSLVKTFAASDMDKGKLVRDSEIIVGELLIIQGSTEYTYSGTTQKPGFTVKIGDTKLDNLFHYTIEWQEDDTYIDAGIYDTKIVFSTDVRMNSEEDPDMPVKTFSWTIAKADPKYKAPALNFDNLTYNGTAQSLYSSLGSTNDGIMMYKVNDGEWLTYIEEKTYVGLYLIYYKVVGDKNHNDVSENIAYGISIYPRSLKDSNFIVEYGDNYNGKETVYDGTEKSPVIKAGFDLNADGEIDLELKKDEEYTVTFDTDDFTNAGEKKLQLTPISDNFKDVFEDTVTIRQKNISELQISHDKTAPIVYDGEAHVPTVTVKDGDNILTEGVDYEISWDNMSGFVVAHPYEATITGKGNYSGTATLEYEISKAPVRAEIIAPEWVIPDSKLTLFVKIYRTDTGEEITDEYESFEYHFFYSKNDSSGNNKIYFSGNTFGFPILPGDVVYLWLEVQLIEGKYQEFILDTPIELKATSASDVIVMLENAMADVDSDLSDRISALSTALDNAISAYQSADGALKEELASKIETADALLDAAIKEAEKDLDDAKAELNKAISDGDSALDGKITALNEALETAKIALEAADTANKSELSTKINEAYSAIDVAVKAVQKKLDDLKTALEAKDNELVNKDVELVNKDAELTNKDAELAKKDSELQTFIIIVSVVSGIALCGSGAFMVWFFIDRKKRI